jgi:hypothetical protein
MQIEDLRRWHWVVAGIIVGLVLGYVWTGIEPSSVRNTSLPEFMRDVSRVDPQTKQPLIQGIVIHPPKPNFEAEAARQRIARYEAEAIAAERAAASPPADVADRAAFIEQKKSEAEAARAEVKLTRESDGNKRVSVVTYKRLMRNSKTGEVERVPRQVMAEVPFVPPGQGRGSVDPNLTLAHHLDQMQKAHPHITYRNAWWSNGPVAVAMWTIGGAIVIGGLWPVVLNGLVGAGMGRKRDTRAEYNPDRFKAASYREPEKPAAPRVTQEDQDRLREMTRQLESNLGELGHISTGSQPGQGATDGMPAIRKLDGGPLEVATAMTPAEEDDVEVKGEYYPVLIHHKKKHDDPEQHPGSGPGSTGSA